jgi:hypothetical protein
MTRPAKQSPAIQLPILADLQSRGDGTFILRPRVVESDMDTWISPKEAARILGVAKRGVYDLVASEAPYLVARHPAARKIVISLKSVEALRRATVSAAFWTTDTSARNAVLAKNRAALAALAAPGN